MAFNIICPPTAIDMFTGTRPANLGTCMSFEYSKDKESILEIPSLNEFHFMTSIYLPAEVDSYFLTIHSKNHEIKFMGSKSHNSFNIYNDEEIILSDIKLKFSADIKLNIYFSNNHLIIRQNGDLIAEYTNTLLAGEAITSISLKDPWRSNNMHINWLIVSSEKIPLTANVKTISAEADTDWEQEDPNVYQTAEVEKIMKIKVPESYSPPKGKTLFASAPFLQDVTGGGDANKINIHAKNFDINKSILEKPQNIGYYSGDGEVVFTTKE